MTRFVTIGLLVLLTAAHRPAAHHPAAPSPTTLEMYMSINGSRQGQFKGERTRVGSRELEGWFKVLSYQNGGRMPPSDVRTTRPTVEVHPFTVTKEVDAASPKLVQAMKNRESLSVILQLRHMPQQQVSTITMKNALVVSRETESTTETITFSYTQIIFTETPKPQ